MVESQGTAQARAHRDDDPDPCRRGQYDGTGARSLESSHRPAVRPWPMSRSTRGSQAWGSPASGPSPNPMTNPGCVTRAGSQPRGASPASPAEQKKSGAASARVADCEDAGAGQTPKAIAGR